MRVQVYEAGMMTHAADAATSSGEVLSHVHVALHRNPFTETLEVSHVQHIADTTKR